MAENVGLRKLTPTCGGTGTRIVDGQRIQRTMRYGCADMAEGAYSFTANLADRGRTLLIEHADVLRQGATKGMWCLGFLAEPNAPKPETLYHQDNPPPITAEPEGDAWFICTREHAKQLGWLESIIRDPNIIAIWLEQAAESLIEVDAATLAQAVERQHGKVDPQIFAEQLDNLLVGRK